MNHDDAPFDNPMHEREWQAQERALRAERLGLDPSNGDERVRRYRMLARALREPMPSALPADFAQQMVARVAAAPARSKAYGSHFEFALIGALVATLAVAAIAVIADYGSTWLPAFRQLPPAVGSPSMNWMLALGSCIAASWLVGLWQKPGHGATR